MTKEELAQASRETLLAIIAEQHARIAQVEARIAELEAGRGNGPPHGMPGHKSTARPAPVPKPRMPRPQGFARMRGVPTEQVVHAQGMCPDCGVTLLGGWGKRTREVIAVEPARAKVIEHVFLERQGPRCGKHWVPKVNGDGIVVGQQRLGIGLVSLIAALREEGRLPRRTVQWYLETVHQMRRSVGGIVGALRQVRQHTRTEVAGIQERVRASPVVNADETGWRQDGHNGYVWTFSTPTERYFIYDGRNKAVVDAALGEAFVGVLVSDFYAAYDHYAGFHQRCWAHLLWEPHDLKELYPEDGRLSAGATAAHALYLEAKAFASPVVRERQAAQARFPQRLLALCQPFLADDPAPQRRLCRRMARFLPELFVFVADPAVPADNNAAERSLRHLVTSRKISGGTRSDEGTDTKMALSTLFGTWRAQGLHPLLACRTLLASPQI